MPLTKCLRKSCVAHSELFCGSALIMPRTFRLLGSTFWYRLHRPLIVLVIFSSHSSLPLKSTVNSPFPEVKNSIHWLKITCHGKNVHFQSCLSAANLLTLKLGDHISVKSLFVKKFANLQNNRLPSQHHAKSEALEPKRTAWKGKKSKKLKQL